MNINAVDKNMSKDNKEVTSDIVFLSPKDKKHFLLTGTIDSVDHFYRFDKKEREIILKGSKDVEWLSYHSSGISLHFYTDSTHLILKGKNQVRFDMINMTHIAQSGFALYYFDKTRNRYMHHSSLRFNLNENSYNIDILEVEKKEKREYILYFPLYIGVEELEIGVDKDSKTTPYIYKNKTKVGIYGTSITQGCSASQSGLCYTNIISRKLDVEVFNFGFSGNANLHDEVAKVLANRKLDILVMDVEPNAGMTNILEEKIESFLDKYFEVFPKGKIIYFSRYTLCEDLRRTYQQELRDFYYQYIPKIVKKYQDKHFDITYVDGSKIFKDEDLEFSTDTLHPDSYGMNLIADYYIEVLKKVI